MPHVKGTAGEENLGPANKAKYAFAKALKLGVHGLERNLQDVYRSDRRDRYFDGVSLSQSCNHARDLQPKVRRTSVLGIRLGFSHGSARLVRQAYGDLVDICEQMRGDERG